MRHSAVPEGSGFASLEEVATLFSYRPAVFAGWVHYISFDLLAGRYIVIDSQKHGIPHLAIVWTVPLTLLFGPAGLVCYMGVRSLWALICGRKEKDKSA
eukprot:CAMPEP_0170190168 /NCGR_PEP_ID=MMETSP0040_2-20121228/48785_1 /TAXON_ID=641309 /ORGANISM="Lotharella oceanica, Strain CCMP622" /LENGTH=98 /DNA_ID=CAMNT_0010437979 /DNA_START=62 /DNA_END=358 /DNA_ORIENTATION=+